MNSDERAFPRLTRTYEIGNYLQRLAHDPRPTLRVRLGALALRLQSSFLPHYVTSNAVPRWRRALRFGERPPPDFAIVAAVKSGSSDLATRLMLHPCVIPPLAKEITHEDPAAWLRYFPTARERTRVARRHGFAMSGYFAPYLHWERLPALLHDCNPSAKVVLLLRDPVERAHAHWKWERFLGGRTALEERPDMATFERYLNVALAAFPDIQLPSYSGCPFLEGGLYAAAVERWIARFGPARVLMVDAGAYFMQPAETLQRIQGFLGLPPIPLPEIGAIVNRNPLKLPPLGAGARATLREFYREDLARVEALVGLRLRVEASAAT